MPKRTRNPTPEEIVKQVTRTFKTMGAGQRIESNPIARMLEEKPAVFVTGVDVLDVVKFVLEYSKIKIPVE